MPSARIIVWLLAGFMLFMAARHGRAFLRGRQGFELLSAVFWGLLCLRLLTGVTLLTWAALAVLVAQLLLRVGAGRAAGRSRDLRVIVAPPEPRPPPQLPPAGSAAAPSSPTSGSGAAERPASPEADLGEPSPPDRGREGAREQGEGNGRR